MKLLFAVVLSLATLVARPAHAQPTVADAVHLIGAASDVVAVVRREKPYAEVFAPVFVSAVPEDQFRALIAQIEDQYGPLQGVGESMTTGPQGTFGITFRFEKAIGNALIHLEADEPYRIDGFRLSSFDMFDDDAGKITAELQALPGLASALVTPLGGDPVLAFQSDREMALGSTFKLYVLSALAHQVAAGERNWSDVVPLGFRSLPSGQMQTWPDGAPVTLQTLATMMISISDNTATDTLVRLVGQDALAAELKVSGHSQPALNAPFLTTRQLFQLKGGEDDALVRYSQATAEERLGMLRDLDAQSIDPGKVMGKLSGAPRALEIEWFASARDIARVLNRIRKLSDPTAREILAVNPSMAPDKVSEWAYVGYKGGSEPGVLNLSWLLQDKAGRWFAVVSTWNDPQAPVDQAKLGFLAERMIALARDD